MSVTASNQPTGVGEHPLAIWRTRMRTVAAVTLVAAGALQVGGDLLEPDVEGYAEKLTWVAGHPDTYTVSSILWFLSIPLLIGVAAVFIALGRVRSPKLAWTGGALLILGMVALGVIQGVEAGIYVGAAGTDLGPDIAEQMFTALDSSALPAGVRQRSAAPVALAGLLWHPAGFPGRVLLAVRRPAGGFRLVPGAGGPGPARHRQLPVRGGFPLCLAAAVVRYGWFDGDRILSRTAGYAILTTLIIAAFGLGVGVLGETLGGAGLGAVAAAVAIAVFLAPVHQTVQRLVDRVVYGERRDPYAALTRLGRRLQDAPDPDEVLPAVVESVRMALRAVRGGGDGGRAGTRGARRGGGHLRRGGAATLRWVHSGHTRGRVAPGAA